MAKSSAKRFSEQDKNAAYKMYTEENKTMAEIAKHFKANINSVRTWVNSKKEEKKQPTKQSELISIAKSFITVSFPDGTEMKIPNKPSTRAALINLIG